MNLDYINLSSLLFWDFFLNGFLFFKRLPIVQGGTISFLVPTLAILKLPQWRCPSADIINNMNPGEQEELWQVRMRELSGAIAVSALFQMFIGFTGKFLLLKIIHFKYCGL